MASEFAYALTENDHLEANRLHFWANLRSLKALRSVSIIAGIYFLLAIGTNIFLGNIGLHDMLISALIALAATFAVLLICYGLGYLLLPRRSRKLFNQQKLLRLETSYQIADDAICYTNELIDAKLPLMIAHKWAENGQTFVVYLTDQSFVIFPKRSVPVETIEAMKAKLISLGISGKVI